MVILNLSKLKNLKIIKICNKLEESFANLTLDQGFSSRIYKRLSIFSHEDTIYLRWSKYFIWISKV